MQANENVIYEVAVELDPEIVQEYLAWLPHHIERVMTNPGFLAYKMDQSQLALNRVVIRYTLKSRMALENYFQTAASDLRKEATEKFGSKYSATRKVLNTSFTEIV